MLKSLPINQKAEFIVSPMKLSLSSYYNANESTGYDLLILLDVVSLIAKYLNLYK